MDGKYRSRDVPIVMRSEIAITWPKLDPQDVEALEIKDDFVSQVQFKHESDKPRFTRVLRNSDDLF